VAPDPGTAWHVFPGEGGPGGGGPGGPGGDGPGALPIAVRRVGDGSRWWWVVCVSMHVLEQCACAFVCVCVGGGGGGIIRLPIHLSVCWARGRGGKVCPKLSYVIALRVQKGETNRKRQFQAIGERRTKREGNVPMSS
jgi:hypothetical protein